MAGEDPQQKAKLGRHNSAAASVEKRARDN